MNDNQFEISTRSPYSWSNLHGHAFVPCRKCSCPLTPTEYAPAINEVGKVVVARLPERCASCVSIAAKKRAAKATASNVVELFPTVEKAQVSE